MALAPENSEVVSLLIEAVLYGLYTFLFGCTIYVLIYKRSTRHVHFGMFIATVLMYILAGVHLITNLVRIYKAFSYAQTHSGSAKMLADVSTFENILRSSALLTEIVLGDILLLYRCYVAWGSKTFIIIIPSLFVIGTAAAACGVIFTFSQAPKGTTLFQLQPAERFLIITQAFVITNNIVCTVLLSWKLWSMGRSVVSRSQRRSLRAVAKIIAQSGLITTSNWIIWMVLTSVKHFSHVIVLNALAPMTGASFCLIVSRVALGMSSEKQATPENEARNQVSRYRGRGVILGPMLPVLDGTGRRHRPVEITVTSRESIRIETDMQMPHQDKISLINL